MNRTAATILTVITAAAFLVACGAPEDEPPNAAEHTCYWGEE